MKKLLIFVVMIFLTVSMFAYEEIAQIVTGAELRLAELLNKPALVFPVKAVPLGRNWFTLEMDAHMFSDQVSLNQVRETLLDFENHDRIFNGERNKRQIKNIIHIDNEIHANFVSITPAPLGFQIRITYRVIMRIIESNDTRFVFEILQTLEDSSSNKDMRHHRAIRYVEEVVIDGNQYTYFRLYSINDVNGSILPNARNVFERNAAPANVENMQLIINAAKLR